jgi:hypothetical protein
MKASVLDAVNIVNAVQYRIDTGHNDLIVVGNRCSRRDESNSGHQLAVLSSVSRIQRINRS